MQEIKVIFNENILEMNTKQENVDYVSSECFKQKKQNFTFGLITNADSN